MNIFKKALFLAGSIFITSKGFSSALMPNNGMDYMKTSINHMITLPSLKQAEQANIFSKEVLQALKELYVRGLYIQIQGIVAMSQQQPPVLPKGTAELSHYATKFLKTYMNQVSTYQYLNQEQQDELKQLYQQSQTTGPEQEQAFNELSLRLNAQFEISAVWDPQTPEVNQYVQGLYMNGKFTKLIASAFPAMILNELKVSGSGFPKALIDVLELFFKNEQYASIVSFYALINDVNTSEKKMKKKYDKYFENKIASMFNQVTAETFDQIVFQAEQEATRYAPK